MAADCPVCGTIDSRELYDCRDQYGDHYHLFKCANCADHFLAPFPTPKQLQRAYSKDYYGAGERKFSPLVEGILNFFRSRKAAGIARYLSNGDRILDLGCGDGELLHQLGLQADLELHGLEIEGKAAERAAKRKQIQLKIGQLEMHSYPPDYFNLISLIHVFEHLPKPSETLKIIKQQLKSGGYLIIEQPNIESWQARVFKGHWLHLDPPRHLNMMGPKALKRLLQNHGFECIKESYFSPQFSPFGVQQSLLNLVCSKREVLYEHLKGNREYVKDYSTFGLMLQKLFHWLTFPLFVLTDGIVSVLGKGGTMKMVFRRSEI